MSTNITLKQALKEIFIDEPEAIPWIVRLIENPSSPIALPGKISLYNHDCLHVLLGCGVTLQDEAYIIGFTMGNDPAVNRFYVWLFKFVSQFLYPRKYRFRREDFSYYANGFEYGVKLRAVAQFNRIDFKQYEQLSVAQLRVKFNVETNERSRNL